MRPKANRSWGPAAIALGALAACGPLLAVEPPLAATAAAPGSGGSLFGGADPLQVRVDEPLSWNIQAPDHAAATDPQTAGREVLARVAEPLGRTLEDSGDAAPADSRSLDARSPELIGLIRSWARAWADQRVHDYLAFYSRRFTPAQGTSREAWERLRRERLEAPQFIEVTVSSIGVGPVKADRASVSFTQTYRSDLYADTVVKSLDLGREEGSWKILTEVVDRVISDPSSEGISSEERSPLTLASLSPGS